MPVGIPKIPHQFGEEKEDAFWNDLYNRLHRERLLFLGKQLNSEVAGNLGGLLVCLSLEDATRPFFMFINCPGGWVVPGFCLYDVMQHVSPSITTMALGEACSIGSVILAGGEINKRLAFPNARVMVHQPASSYFSSPAGKTFPEMTELRRLRARIINIYLRRTRTSKALIEEALDRDTFLSPEEALNFGIVDLLADSPQDPETGTF